MRPGVQGGAGTWNSIQKYHPLACSDAHVAHAWMVRRSAVQLPIHGSPHVATFEPVMISVPFRVQEVTVIPLTHDMVSVQVSHCQVYVISVPVVDIVSHDAVLHGQIIHVRILYAEHSVGQLNLQLRFRMPLFPVMSIRIIDHVVHSVQVSVGISKKNNSSPVQHCQVFQAHDAVAKVSP